MAPRTRATASSAPASASLTAAPRRRVKITPLDKEPSKPVEEATKPATRSTRSKKPSVATEDEPTVVSTKTTTTKTRGRPKKNDNALGEPKPETEPEQAPEKLSEKLTEKPKRSTRATRATATTLSSEAKGKPTARATRTATITARTKSVEKEESEERSDQKIVPVSKTVPKKKVTFQDIIDEGKENQPITTRGAKKAVTSKSTSQSEKISGLRAKPVRKPTTATRASKRSKPHTSDDEDDKPSKIQRVLTPKKITQVARAVTPDELSEDELNGGKTPVRNLSLSPRRPQTDALNENVPKVSSATKKLDFSQSLLQQSAKRQGEPMHSSLASPARRPAVPISPVKLFSASTIKPPAKNVSDNSTVLASPARRPLESPAKLLFPQATKKDQHVPLSQSSNGLFQSPKRPAIFDPSRLFSQSAIKPKKMNMHSSSFLSSPAKRIGMLSPLKKSSTFQTTDENEGETSPHELNLNDMEVTELLNEDLVEITVTSHQRASVSPMRTYKLSEDELHMDFDDSVLPVRSPLKVVKSPTKAVIAVDEPVNEAQSIDAHQDEDETELLTSPQSTPRYANKSGGSCVSLQAIETDSGAPSVQLEQDLEMPDVGGDTIALSDLTEQITLPLEASSEIDNDTYIDELAPSPEEDVVSRYLHSPKTPASLIEHELTDMASSPPVESTPVASRLNKHHFQPQLSPSLHENELTIMGNAMDTTETPRPVTMSTDDSPISLQENELTIMGVRGVTPTPEVAILEAKSSPVTLYENEITIMGGTPTSTVGKKSVKTQVTSSPASLHENELTMMAAAKTPNASTSPNGLGEHEITLMAEAFSTNSPEHKVMMSLSKTPMSITSPVSIAEGELTVMGDRNSPIAQTPCHVAATETLNMEIGSSKKQVIEDDDRTPIASVPRDTLFTPDLPIPRKFNLHTITSKVPLKPEGQDSPFKLQLKKRKRPLSLGGQPDLISFPDTITTVKSARTSSSPDATSTRNSIAGTPLQRATQRTPATKPSSIKSARRVVSTPVARTPLTPVATSNVLSGAVVYVDVRTSEGADASAIYIDLLIGLGAKVSKEWKDSITHVVYKDGNPKVLEKARMADSDVKMIGVSWPLDCEAQKTWVDETDYLLNLTPTDIVFNSVTKSARRKSMEPSTLIADGTGSVKRSRSRARASIGNRRSIVHPPDNVEGTPLADRVGSQNGNLPAATPQVSTAKKQANLEKNSLTAAWKSINATQNLGEDTPARRTLELLQKSYQMQNEWDDSMISSNSNEENDENTPRPHARPSHQDDDDDLVETGLTPAPYKTKMEIGSAPSKINNSVAMMSYRERVEEMERREMRDNAFGTNKGSRGRAGKRMTMFGFEPAA